MWLMQLDGINWWLELLEEASQPIGPERQDFQQFLQGTTAMVKDGPWTFSNIPVQAPDLNWSAVLIPAKPVPGGQMSTCIWNNMLAMPSKGTKKDSGWKLLKYWCDLDFMLKRLEFGQWMSPRKDFYETKEYNAAIEALPALKNVQLAANVGTTVAFIEEESTEATVRPILESVMLGDLEPQAAVDQMVEKCNEILAKAGYE